MVSAGGQDTGDGSFDIKVPGLYETIEDILNTPVKTNGDSVITFRDIAEVKRTFEDRQSYANVNGSKSITIDVSKRIGENIINTCLLYTSPSPRDGLLSRMPSSA